jgi:hypothetical protein
MMSLEQPYTENFDVLVAIVTHLSNTEAESRSVPGMARDLGLDEKKVRTVVDRFQAFFRKGTQPNNEGQYYYTLHLRYSRRKIDGEGVSREQLRPEELSTLLDLISKMVANEHEMSRLSLELKQRNRTLIFTNILTLIAALIAAAAAITAAFLKK